MRTTQVDPILKMPRGGATPHGEEIYAVNPTDYGTSFNDRWDNSY